MKLKIDEVDVLGIQSVISLFQSFENKDVLETVVAQNTNFYVVLSDLHKT